MTWERVVLIANIMVGYDINFVRQIWLKIQIRAFSETTTLPVLGLIQQLCDMARVQYLHQVNHMIEVTHTIDLSLIKDLANPVLAQREPPSRIAIPVHFEGPYILIEAIEGPDVTVDIDMDDQRVEPNTSTVSTQFKDHDGTYSIPYQISQTVPQI